MSILLDIALIGKCTSVLVKRRGVVAQDIVRDIFQHSGAACVKQEGNVSKARPALIFGQNGVGKSNFCCFLVNCLLSIFDKVSFK